jgi:hypothetical protein
MTDEPRSEFERAGDEGSGSLAADFLAFIRQNKKYYLIPLLIVLGAMGLLLILGGTAAAPFIYTLF